VKQVCVTDNLLDASHIHCLLSSAFIFVFTYDSFPTMSSTIYILLRPLCPLFFPPKLLSACHHDAKRAPVSYVSSAVLFLRWIFFTNSFPSFFICDFSVQLIYSILLHTQLSKWLHRRDCITRAKVCSIFVLLCRSYKIPTNFHQLWRRLIAYYIAFRSYIVKIMLLLSISINGSIYRYW